MGSFGACLKSWINIHLADVQVETLVHIHINTYVLILPTQFTSFQNFKKRFYIYFQLTNFSWRYITRSVTARRWKGMGMLGPNCVIAKDVTKMLLIFAEKLGNVYIHPSLTNSKVK